MTIIYALFVFILAVFYIYKKSRRITSVTDLPEDVNGVWLTGKVTEVCDGNTVKFVHTTWFGSAECNAKNVNAALLIRLAGIEALETAHFGILTDGYMFALLAGCMLEKMVLGKNLEIKLLGKDRCNRLLGMCYMKKSCLNRIDVNMLMDATGNKRVTTRHFRYDYFNNILLRYEAFAKENNWGSWEQDDNCMSYVKKFCCCSNVNVNMMMVLTGMARCYRGRNDVCKILLLSCESFATKNEFGLWEQDYPTSHGTIGLSSQCLVSDSPSTYYYPTCRTQFHETKKSKQIISAMNLPFKVGGVWLLGKVTSVCDGDGFNFLHINCGENITFRIRLAGIDAPEMGNFKSGIPAQPFASEAKAELEKLVLGKYVELKFLGNDWYDRLLVMCYTRSQTSVYYYLDSTCTQFHRLKFHRLMCNIKSQTFETINVNTKMVELGMACVYQGRDAKYDDYENTLLRLEDIAKQQKLGIWSQDKYVSPMDHKKINRYKTKT